jgi:hypothetical protein
VRRAKFFKVDRVVVMGLPASSGPHFGESPRSESVPTAAIVPTDERLVDYLLGQPTAVAAQQRASLSDAEIEAWLGRDQANLARLESLAVSVVALLGHEQTVARPLAEPAFVSVTPVTPARSSWGVVRRRHSFSIASWVVAVVLMAAFGSYFGWRDRDSTDPRPGDLSGELAMAWAEQAAVDSPTLPFSSSPLDESWEAAWREWESGALIELPEDSSDTALADVGPAFADGGESPPDWLVLAVAQLSRFPDTNERSENPEP